MKETNIIQSSEPIDTSYKQTQYLYVASKLLHSHLDALYALLAFIFYKDLHATPLQLTLLISLKPTSALLSFYGTLFIHQQHSRLKSFLACASLLGAAPCFLFPFITNNWFFIFAFGLFMMCSRAKIPAWTEVLKVNLSSEARSRIFSRGAILSYLANIAIPLLISPFIDRYPHSWKWIFFTVAALQIINVLLIVSVKLKKQNMAPSRPNFDVSLSAMLLEPWKNCWTLFRQRIDFRHYQIVFILGGAGLMVMQPVQPIFFKEVLHLSYTELSIAICFFKGIGYALTSPIWSKWLHNISIHMFNFFVTLFAGIFGFIVLLSAHNVNWIYVAFFLYGIMQAGSELSWHLAGPIFSKDKDSTIFTGVNVAMVGLRGSIAPFLGEIIFLLFGTSMAFGCGSLLCLTGSLYSIWAYYATKRNWVQVPVGK